MQVKQYCPISYFKLAQFKGAQRLMQLDVHIKTIPLLLMTAGGEIGNRDVPFLMLFSFGNDKIMHGARS